MKNIKGPVVQLVARLAHLVLILGSIGDVSNPFSPARVWNLAEFL